VQKIRRTARDRQGPGRALPVMQIAFRRASTRMRCGLTSASPTLHSVIECIDTGAGLAMAKACTARKHHKHTVVYTGLRCINETDIPPHPSLRIAVSTLFLHDGDSSPILYSQEQQNMQNSQYMQTEYINDMNIVYVFCLIACCCYCCCCSRQLCIEKINAEISNAAKCNRNALRVLNFRK
jgi:hypothetical protein